MQYYRRGDVVWAQAQNQPAWPAKIVKYEGEEYYSVSFINHRTKYGPQQHRATLRSSNLFDYVREREQHVDKINTAKFKEAIRIADRFFEEGGHGDSRERSRKKEQMKLDKSNSEEPSPVEEPIAPKRKREEPQTPTKEDQAALDSGSAGRKKVKFSLSFPRRALPLGEPDKMESPESHTVPQSSVRCKTGPISTLRTEILPKLQKEARMQSAAVQTITGMGLLREVGRRVDTLKRVVFSADNSTMLTSGAAELEGLAQSLNSIAANMLITGTIEKLQTVFQALEDSPSTREFSSIVERISNELENLKRALFQREEADHHMQGIVERGNRISNIHEENNSEEGGSNDSQERQQGRYDSE